MKFGRNLARNQVPEWSSSYINYKALKKVIKTAAETVKHGGEADLAGKLRAFLRCRKHTQNYCRALLFSRSKP